MEEDVLRAISYMPEFIVVDVDIGLTCGRCRLSVVRVRDIVAACIRESTGKYG